MNKREKQLVKNLNLINYTGKIKSTNLDTFGSVVYKIVNKTIENKNYTFTVAYEIRSHQISLPFDDSIEVREALRYGKTVAREILESEMHELLDRYIDITIKDMEINNLYKDTWQVLTRSDGSIYKDIRGNIILVKYYRITPTSEFLSRYHSIEELKRMEKETN